jgi:uncharacterized membrane protein
MNGAVFIALPMLALCWAIMFVLPHLSPLRYFFAITVPPDFPSGESGRAILRRYHWRLAALLLCSVASVWPLAAYSPVLAIAYSMMLPVVGGMACFLLARNQVRRFSASLPPLREAELSTAPDRLPRWIALALPPFAAPLATAAYLRAHWAEIPARFPLHYDLAGTPDRWAEKTARGIYGPLLFAAGLMLLLLLLCVAIFHGARRGRQRAAMLKLEIAALYFMAYIFAIVALMPLLHISLAASLLPTVLFVIGVAAWGYKLARDPEMPVDPTPDQYWRLGSFYYNPNDPAIFVQKRIGLGYTLNFGNPFSWITTGMVAAGVIALALVLPR